MDLPSEDLHAPGRRRLKRRGRVDVYWVADKTAVRQGFLPKTVFLRDDPGDDQAPAEIAARCRFLWAQMREWMAGNTASGARYAVGTVGWLADFYQSDKDSPYRSLRPSSRPGYDRALAIIGETVGERRIDAVTANDVRRWFRGWGRAVADGALENPRRAYGCVQLLRIIVRFGRGQRIAGCRDLSEILSETEFPAPRGRRVAMTAEQASAICAKAHELGERGIARAVAIQFGCALRQKDVIGEWIEGRWTSGLLWGEHVQADWMLVKPTSKTNFRETAEFDLRFFPFVMAELSAAPLTSRIGPVVLDDRTGRPFRQREFARRFRTVARAAGVPDTVWNMDSRAGAVTDARSKGATREDAMKFATHNQASTNAHYDRDRASASSRVAVLRFGKREGEPPE
jgi:hypothetical protein